MPGTDRTRLRAVIAQRKILAFDLASAGERERDADHSLRLNTCDALLDGEGFRLQPLNDVPGAFDEVPMAVREVAIEHSLDGIGSPAVAVHERLPVAVISPVHSDHEDIHHRHLAVAWQAKLRRRYAPADELAVFLRRQRLVQAPQVPGQFCQHDTFAGVCFSKRLHERINQRPG